MTTLLGSAVLDITAAEIITRIVSGDSIMIDINFDALHSDIAMYLNQTRVEPSASEDRRERRLAFWGLNVTLTEREIAVLRRLTVQSMELEVLARNLGYDLQRAQDRMEVFRTKGLVERYGDYYASSAAARLYFQMAPESHS